MSHSVTHIWVHVIWCTYCRERSLAGGLAKLMEEHLRAYALERQIRV